MRVRYLFNFLLAGLAFGQATQPPAHPAADATIKATEVSSVSDDPVITINGFCENAGRQSGACKTVITRAQFEKLAEALQPGMSLSLQLNVANAYARNLRMSAAAEKRGLDKTPAFEEEMRFARMQLLSQDLNRALKADADNVSDADLEDYYTKNESSFEQATVARIFIPHAKQIPTAKSEQPGPSDGSQNNAAVEEMTRAAADFRARAAQGEDLDKLQIEAYALAGIPNSSSNTKMEKVRRSTLPPRHEAVLDLKPGEVSEVFSDPDGGHFIYKLITNVRLPFQDVKSEIQRAISSQRYRDSMKSFEGDVVFSDAYFNPSDGSAMPAARGSRGKRRKLAADIEEHGK
jgi:hypothetical protein